MAKVSPAGAVGIQRMTARFVENGAGTYTADFTLPAGSTLYDIVATAEAVWTAGTSASLEVGNSGDADGYIAATNLKATDLLAGESISIGGGTDVAGGKAGADAVVGTNTHIVDRYYAAEEIIKATVVSVGAGTAGRTRVDVLYFGPQATTITQ